MLGHGCPGHPNMSGTQGAVPSAAGCGTSRAGRALLPVAWAVEGTAGDSHRLHHACAII